MIQTSKALIQYLIGGTITVSVNNSICFTKEFKQYRFPKTKKIRIQKKWKRNHNNWRLQDVRFRAWRSG